MCMGIIPCPQSPLGLDAICATLPEVGGETFRFSCVIWNKKQNMGWCLCVSGRLRSVCFKRGLAIPQRFQHAALRRHGPGMCHIPARKGKRRGAQAKDCMKLGACLQDVAAAGGNQQLLQPSRCLGRT